MQRFVSGGADALSASPETAFCQTSRAHAENVIFHRLNNEGENRSMKHIKTLETRSLCDSAKNGGCGECQTSCQSACKTSCGIANQQCEHENGNAGAKKSN